MKEICRAFTKVIVQGLLDYKLVIFKGSLYVLAGFLPVFVAQLKEFNEISALGDLQWKVIIAASIYGAVVNLLAYLSKDAAEVEKTINKRNGTNIEFHTEFLKKNETTNSNPAVGK